MFEIIVTIVLCACLVAATITLCTLMYKIFKEDNEK